MFQARDDLEIPAKAWRDLIDIAEKRGITTADLLRRATRLFLFVSSIKDDPGARLLLERAGRTQEVIVDLI